MIVVSVVAWLLRVTWYVVCFLNPLRTLRRFELVRRFVDTVRPVSALRRLTDRLHGDAANVKLLQWVSDVMSSQKACSAPSDLGPSWRDGIALCCLVNSLCPGACPDVASLKPYHRVKNCRLGLRLANQHLDLPLNSFSAEDIASNGEHQEQKVRSLLVILQRLSAKNQMQPATASDPCKSTDDASRCEPSETNDVTTCSSNPAAHHAERVAISGLVGTPCRLELCLPSWMDPDELSAEVQWYADVSSSRSSLHSIPEDEQASSTHTVPVDIQRQTDVSSVTDIVCVHLSFVPCRPGMHLVFVRWRDDDVTGSPFHVSVSEQVTVVSGPPSQCRRRRMTFGDAAAAVMSRVKTGRQMSTSAPPAEGHSGGGDEFRQLAVMANTLYGVTAAVLRRTSKVERSLSISGKAVDLIKSGSARVKRRRVIQQVMSTSDGSEQQIFIASDPALSRQSTFTSFDLTSDSELLQSEDESRSDDQLSRRLSLPQRAVVDESTSTFDRRSNQHNISTTDNRRLSAPVNQFSSVATANQSPEVPSSSDVINGEEEADRSRVAANDVMAPRTSVLTERRASQLVRQNAFDRWVAVRQSLSRSSLFAADAAAAADVKTSTDVGQTSASRRDLVVPEVEPTAAAEDDEMSATCSSSQCDRSTQCSYDDIMTTHRLRVKPQIAAPRLASRGPAGMMELCRPRRDDVIAPTTECRPKSMRRHRPVGLADQSIRLTTNVTVHSTVDDVTNNNRYLGIRHQLCLSLNRQHSACCLDVLSFDEQQSTAVFD